MVPSGFLPFMIWKLYFRYTAAVPTVVGAAGMPVLASVCRITLPLCHTVSVSGCTWLASA